MTTPFPEIPEGLSLPFYYSALLNCGVNYLVDYDRCAKRLEGTGFTAARFDGAACVSFNYQLYVGQFRQGASITQEVEYNVICHPDSRRGQVPDVTFEQYALGDEQSRHLGNLRLHVPCDNELAIAAGETLFGEPKFRTTFTTELPTPNAPGPETWMFRCHDPEDAEASIFTCLVDLSGLTPIPASFSPVTEYGVVDGVPIGARWNILSPLNAHLLGPGRADRVRLTFGESNHPMGTDMREMLEDAEPASVFTFRSAPAAVQSRAYYV
ncbi:hypothetical protein Stsp01_24610 [Streptomyces sp. NBRC 13847]|uniref:hypothetical protein n=1 Tax=Streptomyces TaxID=1883 RepID=UPI0024A34D49|nr:hypothetical protein [Streptomyces sp. NBRC 13847]GLW15718.1 hypothetical protein Stsp01_24610 [Streptomyces sp. NBRC 13847]